MEPAPPLGGSFSGVSSSLPYMVLYELGFNLGLGLLSAHLHSYQQDRVCAIRSAGAAGGRECFLFDPDSNPDQTDMA